MASKVEIAEVIDNIKNAQSVSVLIKYYDSHTPIWEEGNQIEQFNNYIKLINTTNKTHHYIEFAHILSILVHQEL